jgi:hypothetical protein
MPGVGLILGKPMAERASQSIKKISGGSFGGVRIVYLIGQKPEKKGGNLWKKGSLGATQPIEYHGKKKKREVVNCVQMKPK